jgi:hypothetical protein
MTVKKRAENRRSKLKNVDKVRASARKANKKYRAANSDKVRAWKRAQIVRYRQRYPEKLAEQVKRARSTRRAKLIALLGGKCVGCGTTARLEADHRLPRTRKFNLSGASLLRAWETVVAEAGKCDLRCPPCHSKKTRLEQAAQRALKLKCFNPKNKNMSPKLSRFLGVIGKPSVE